MSGENEFTEEELKILGEVEEPEPDTEPETDAEESEAEGEATEQDAEAGEAGEESESAPEDVSDEPDKVQKRIDTLTWEKKTAQEKLDLFKTLGADGYYKLYPDEKPDEPEQPKPKPSGALPKEIVETRQLEMEGGDYATFGELFDADPAEAYRISPYHARMIDDYNRDQESARQKREQEIKDAETERIDKFASSLSSEMFGSDDPDALPRDQQKQLGDKINEVMDWMEQTGRLHYNIDDAYQIMTGGKRIADAQVAGAKKVVDKLSKPVKSIQTSGGDTQAGEYDRYINMSADRFAQAIEKMPDKKFDKLMREKPPELVKKFPSAPWED